MPALMDSPRSTRGMTRTIAYSNGSRGPDTVGLLDEWPRAGEPSAEVPDVRTAMRVGIGQVRLGRQPVVRGSVDQIVEPRGVQQPREALIRCGDGPGEWQQHVVADAAKGRRACSSGSRHVWWTYSAAPWSMRCTRRCQTRRFGLRAVRSMLVVSASNQTMSAASSGSGAGWHRRVEGQRSRQEVHPEVQAARAQHRRLQLRVGLGAPERRVDIHEHELGHGKAERPRHLADQQLRDERLRTLRRAGELQDVQAVVVGFDQCRHGATAAERRDIAGGDDRPEHAASVGARRMLRCGCVRTTSDDLQITHGPHHPRRPRPRSPIDITTTGRRSGEPRRLEIVFHNVDGHLYISGIPNERTRGWIHNLEADPALTIHLKGRDPHADLPAKARIIVDENERRAVLPAIARAWKRTDLETMVAWSPLIEVEVPGYPG